MGALSTWVVAVLVHGVWALLIALSAPVYLFVSFGFQHKITRFLPGVDTSSEVAQMVWPIVSR